MALDLQAILNEAVSEVLEAQAKGNANPTPNQPEQTNPNENSPGGKQEHDEDYWDKIKEFFGKAKEKIEQGAEEVGEALKNPYVAAATGALTAGAGALGLRKLIQKRRQKKLA